MLNELFATNAATRRERLAASLIALLSVALPIVLYGLRTLDDNRLVSWNLIADWVQPAIPMAGIMLGVPVAYGLASFRLPGPALLFPLAFFASALFWGMPETIVDASRYFTQAKHLAIYGPGFFLTEWGGEIDAWTDLPVMSFLYGLIFKYGGEIRIYAQILNSLLFATAVTTTALFAEELWSRETGNIAGALLLAVPYLFTQTPLLLVDIGAMAFFVLAAYFFLIYLRRGDSVLAGVAALVIFLAFFSKYSVWLMLFILGTEFLLVLQESPAAALRRGIFVALLSGLIIGLALIFYADVIREQLVILREFQQPRLRAWEESFTSTFLFHTHPFVAIGAGGSLLLAIFRRDIRYLVVAWLVLLFVPGMQIRRIRYLVPIFPLLTIMAAYGLGVISSARVRRFIVYCAVSGSLVIALTAYLPFLQGHSIANLKDAGRFMDRLTAESFLVHTLPQQSVVNPAIAVPLLDLYTRKTIYYDYPSAGRPEEEEIVKMSLRFTWGYNNPRYYTSPLSFDPDALVIIWGYGEPSPPGYTLMRKFVRAEKVYSFRPYVSIFSPEGSPFP